MATIHFVRQKEQNGWALPFIMPVSIAARGFCRLAG
jgi:hypothetical protein